MNKPHLTDIARALRHEETEAEKVIWSWLRRKQLNGAKFRRQQPIGNYIVDFVNFDKKLIIKIDPLPIFQLLLCLFDIKLESRIT